MHLARSFSLFFSYFFHFLQILYARLHLSRLLLLLLFHRRLIWHRRDPFRIGAMSPAVCPNFFTLSFRRSIYIFLIDMCLCLFMNPENNLKKKEEIWQFLLLLFFFFVLHKIENTAYPSFFLPSLSLCPIHPSNPRELDHIVECFLILRLLPSPSQVYVYFLFDDFQRVFPIRRLL